MRVLVTGGAGYIGSHVCKALKRRGHSPIVYDNFSTGARALVRFGPCIEGSIFDRERLRGALNGQAIDAVIHLAGLCYPADSVRDPLAYYHANVAGSLCLFEAMRDSGVGRLVFSSSCSVYGHSTVAVDEQAPLRPISPYAQSKMLVEQMLADIARSQAWQAVSLRYFNAAGADPEGECGELHDPEPHLIPRVIQAALGQIDAIEIHGADYPTADGTCVRDYAHVSDLAEAHVLALEADLARAELSVFNLGNARGFSVREIIAAVERELGRPVPVRIGARRAGDPAAIAANSDRARRVLGWQPKHDSLAEIIQTAFRFATMHHPKPDKS